MNLVPPRRWGALASYLEWPLPVLLFDGISGPVPEKARRSLLGPVLDPLVSRRLAAVAGCSEYVVQRNARRFRLEPSRCTVIYNGIDTRRFVAADRRDQVMPIIAVVARLIPEKGVDVLLHACVRIRDIPWHLRIVGHGTEEERLRAIAVRLGLTDRVEFLGLRDDVEATLSEASINVHPCLWEEAFGLTIAEAMAAGCVTIASRIGGIPELITDGETGVLVPPGDDRQLAAALRELLKEPERRRQMATAARRVVEEKFDLGPAVSLQVDWIEQAASPAIVSGRPRTSGVPAAE